MPYFEVSAADGAPVRVEAANWLSALGDGLHALHAVDGLERLACELLPNGRVVARDVRTGRGFVVHPLGAQAPLATEDVDTEPELGAQPHPGWGEEPSEEVFAAPPSEGEDESGELLPARPPMAGRLRELAERVLASPSALLAWHEALDAARALIPSEAGAALEREPGGHLRFLYAFGPRSSGVQGALLPRGVGIAGYAVERATSLLVQDTRADARFCQDFDDVTGFATQAVICVPVAEDGHVHGCLELLNPLLPGGFDPDALATVEALADVLARRLTAP